MLAVALTGGVVERLPVSQTHSLALAVGQLGKQVAQAVHRAVLTVGGGPALPDGFDQPGRAVGHDQQRRAEPAGDQVLASSSQSSCDSRIPSITVKQHALALSVNPQATSTPSLGPSGRTARKTASRNSAATWTS